MTQFEFLTVFISIVLAFGVSDILSSWGAQIRRRHEIRAYWLHTVWSALLLILMIQVWWSLWILRERTDWTFIEYLLLIIPFLTASLIAYVMTPSLKNGRTDIRKHYYDHARWTYSLTAFYVASAMFFSIFVAGESVTEMKVLIRLGAIVLMLTLAFNRNEKIHAAAAVAASAMLAGWIGISMYSL